VDSDAVLTKINEFIDQINRISAINESGLSQGYNVTDKLILSLHNHLGNAKHYISDETFAFNATEQYISIVHAQRELAEVIDDLFSLKQQDVINELDYDQLNITAHELDEQLRKAIDPEFT
jgi:hypothetical protein